MRGTSRVRRELDVALVDGELVALAREASEALELATRKQDELAAHSRLAKEDIEALKVQARHCLAAIQDGRAKREVDCELRWHEPAIAQVTLVRLDTGEIVESRPMTDAELQEELPFEAGGDGASKRRGRSAARGLS